MNIYEAQWMTAIFILLMLLGTVMYDVWIFRAFGPDATISRVCGLVFHAHPIVFAWIIFGSGLYCGHVWLSAWR